MNLMLLIKEIKKYKAKDKQCALFIDLKSAYNTVDRDLLY
jgi:hypothetical protein